MVSEAESLSYNGVGSLEGQIRIKIDIESYRKDWFFLSSKVIF